MAVALEDGVGGAQDAVGDAEVVHRRRPLPQTRHHAREQLGPLVRKVLAADQADGVRELPLDLLGARQHQLDDARLDLRTQRGWGLVDCFFFVFWGGTSFDGMV